MNDIKLIIRADDAGFCHAANMAIEKILKEGVITSISVIVNTPWLDEAVDILKRHPEVSIGVHTVLNSEWKEYRWGPVLPYDKVPSLVDAFGKFYPSRSEMMRHRPKVEEVTEEIRAQIELALRKGLDISYCDYHMGAAVNTLEFQEELEKLAREFNIGISRYFGEKDMRGTYDTPPEQKTAQGINNIDTLTTPGLYLLVVHPGLDTPEMAAMTDLNLHGLKNMSRHRQAETDMLCDPNLKKMIFQKGISLVGYKELKEQGLEKMQRTFTADKYEEVLRKALKNN